MEKSPGEIIDRLSIVRLKIEKIGDPVLQAEMDALQQAVKDFKAKNINIKSGWVDELYKINSEEWDLLDKMNVERKKENRDLAKIGELYLQTEQVNKRRSIMINKIVEETGQGFKEIKKNHPSE